jgi:hypothetical protein
MDFDKMRKRHTPDELQRAWWDGRVDFELVNAANPTSAPGTIPVNLRRHYLLNVEQGSVTTTGNPPSGPNIGPLSLLIKGAEWPDYEKVQMCIAWFKKIIVQWGDVKPQPRDIYARQAAVKFGISQRRFIAEVWDEHAPDTWKLPGAPRR